MGRFQDWIPAYGRTEYVDISIATANPGVSSAIRSASYLADGNFPALRQSSNAFLTGKLKNNNESFHRAAYYPRYRKSNIAQRCATCGYMPIGNHKMSFSSTKYLYRNAGGDLFISDNSLSGGTVLPSYFANGNTAPTYLVNLVLQAGGGGGGGGWGAHSPGGGGGAGATWAGTLWVPDLRNQTIYEIRRVGQGNGAKGIGNARDSTGDGKSGDTWEVWYRPGNYTVVIVRGGGGGARGNRSSSAGTGGSGGFITSENGTYVQRHSGLEYVAGGNANNSGRGVGTSMILDYYTYFEGSNMNWTGGSGGTSGSSNTGGGGAGSIQGTGGNGSHNTGGSAGGYGAGGGGGGNAWVGNLDGGAGSGPHAAIYV